MNDPTENQVTLHDVVDQFLCAATLLTRAAELRGPSGFGMDLVKVSLNRLAGQLREVSGEISSFGFLGTSHQAKINFIVQDALSIKREIGNNAMQSIFLNCALGVLTGDATACSSNDVPANQIEAAPPTRPMLEIEHSDTPEKLAA